MNFEDEALRESEEGAMDNDAEEAPRDLEGAPLPQQPPGHVAPEVVPNKPVAEVPPLPVVVDALKQILAELDVKTTNFGQVRRALAARLFVTEAALEPWRQQLASVSGAMSVFTSQAVSTAHESISVRVVKVEVDSVCFLLVEVHFPDGPRCSK